jgi:O-antigen/teichoic acid export membrane protein
MTHRATVGTTVGSARLQPEDVRNIRQNSIWNALQQTATLASGSIFGVVLVGVLPLREFGVYSYAIALCTVGFAVTTAGLNGLGIKYIVAEGKRGGRSVGTILLIRELFCIATYLVLGGISFTSHDRLTTVATLVALSSLFFRALDAPELWYIAHMRSRRTATIRIVSVMVMAVARIVGMLALPNLWLFIGIFVAEAALVSLWILWRYWFERDAPAMSHPSGSEIRSMARESSPLALSAIADQINLRADIVIIQPLLGSVAVGIYSLAARASELAYFLPVVIMNSTLPVLLRALDESRGSGSDARYRRMLQVSYDRMCQAGVAIAVVVTAICLSPASHLVSSDLQPVFGVLAIHIWATPFVFMGAVYSKWIVAEGYLWSSLIRHSAGAITNIALNFVLIHHWGLKGAAMATVASYAVANYFACFFGKQSRRQGYCMTRALFSPLTAPVRLTRHRYGASHFNTSLDRTGSTRQ